MSLSQNIKKYRLEKELTQEQLANLLGVSAQAVSKWETSETYPDGALLVPLAGALGVSLDVLFGNRMSSMEDISERIQRLIKDTPREKRFHLVRDLCWQMEKGLFFFPEQKELVEKYGLKFVPIISESANIKGMTVSEVLDYATGKSALYDTLREGIVFRSFDGKQSFKAVSPEFLIKNNE